MTKREMLESIVDGTILDETKREDAVAIATKELAQMDANLAKRKDKLTPKQEENLELAQLVWENLSTETAKTANDVFELGLAGIGTVQKASGLLRMLVKTGRATVEDVLVPSKHSVQRAYKKI